MCAEKLDICESKINFKKMLTKEECLCIIIIVAGK